MVRSLVNLVRRRPGTTILIVVLALVGTCAGLYGWALWQWRQARRDLQARRVEDAQRRLSYCLLVWPRSVPVHILAARAARSRGDFETAEAHLNHCLKLQKDANDDVQLEFLLMRVQRGEVDEVAPLLLLAVERGHPQSTLILETLARAYMHTLRYGPAAGCLARWIELDPDNAEPHHWRGWVRQRVNHYSGAVADYERALELDPDLVEVRLRLAEMFLLRANVPQALPHLERLHRQYPDRADVMARLGECRYHQGEKAEARQLLVAARQELPNDSLLLICLAKMDLDENRPERAEQLLRRVLKEDPTDTEARFSLIKALRLQGRKKEADDAQAHYDRDVVMLRRANKLLQAEADRPSNDPNALYGIGVAFLASSQERLGLYWLDQALQLDPRHEPTRRALVEHFEKKGDHKAAAEHRRWLPAGRATGATPGIPGPPAGR
jgi:tetratricopeptide (TPR) repeat protein